MAGKTHLRVLVFAGLAVLLLVAMTAVAVGAGFFASQPCYAGEAQTRAGEVLAPAGDVQNRAGEAQSQLIALGDVQNRGCDAQGRLIALDDEDGAPKGKAINNESDLVSAAETGGTFYLAVDISLESSVLKVNSDDLTINLNGHSITPDADREAQPDANYSAALFYVSDGVTLTIQAGSTGATTGNLISGFDKQGAFYVEGASLVITSTSALHKVKIKDCTFNKWEFQCEDAAHGGAICATKKSQVDLTNVSISECEAIGVNGGGISLDASELTMSNVRMELCSAYDDDAAWGETLNGGAIAAVNSTLDLSDGAVIAECTAADLGGGIYADACKLQFAGTISDCTVGEVKSGSTGKKMGGALYCCNGTITEVSGETTIEDCKAVYDNGAESYGGGICNCDTSTITFSGDSVSFSGCEAMCGGAIYDNHGNLTFTGDKTTFEDCTANQTGGAIYQNFGVVDLNNVAFTGCTATSSGGAYYYYGFDWDSSAETVEGKIVIRTGLSFSGCLDNGQARDGIFLNVFDENKRLIDVEQPDPDECVTVFCALGDDNLTHFCLATCETDSPTDFTALKPQLVKILSWDKRRLVMLKTYNETTKTLTVDVDVVSNETEPEIDPCTVGDLNNNGTINIVDAQIVCDMACGAWTSSSEGAPYCDLLLAALDQRGTHWNETALVNAADFNDDGVVDATDARAIQYYTLTNS